MAGIFDAHRTLGLVTGDLPFHLHRDNMLTVSLGKHFLTYDSEKLKIRIFSPKLAQKVNSVTSHRDLTFIACGSAISAWHKVRQKHTYTTSDAIKYITVFGDYLLGITFTCTMVLWDMQTTEIFKEIPLMGEALAVLHPDTYLNKVVVVYDKSIQLLNIKTTSRICDYPNVTASLTSKITSASLTPALDILALGLQNGTICFVNLLTDQVLFELQQSGESVVSISFSTVENLELMATGGPKGLLYLWDLETRSLKYRIEVQGSIRGVCWLPKEPILIVQSTNQITQFVLDPIPRVLRQRSGHVTPPKLGAFYNTTNVLSLSPDELRIHNIFNEHQSQAFSHKKLSKKLKANIVNFSIKGFAAMASATTRESDWCNIITAHKGLPVPIMWSFENKRISSRNIDIETRNSEVSSCEVTSCGNYGIVGFKNGAIEIFNMQSGFQQILLPTKHASKVIGVAVDALNACLITASRDGVLIMHDFETGRVLARNNLQSKIKSIVMDKASWLLAVATESAVILYDIRTKTKVRSLSAQNPSSLTFSSNGRWVAAISKKSGIKVWDIPSDTCVDWMEFGNNPTSCSFSDGFLATTHENSLGVFLWKLKTDLYIDRPVKDPRKIKGIDIKSGTSIYSAKKVNLDKLLHSEVIPETSNPKAIRAMPKAIDYAPSLTVSQLPFPRIAALWNID